MSLAFAVGLALGSGLVIFGRDTAAGRGLLIRLHVLLAQLRRWRRGRR